MTFGFAASAPRCPRCPGQPQSQEKARCNRSTVQPPESSHLIRSRHDQLLRLLFGNPQECEFHGINRPGYGIHRRWNILPNGESRLF